jgi:hypothetical protein
MRTSGGHVSAVTDEFGRFTLEGLPPGEIQLEVKAPGSFLLSKQNYYPVADAGTTLTLNLLTYPGIQLGGSVVDASTSVPIAGASVSMKGMFATNPSDQTLTDYHGEFHLKPLDFAISEPDDISEGASSFYSLQVNAEGYETTLTFVKITNHTYWQGAEIKQQIPLKPKP